MDDFSPVITLSRTFGLGDDVYDFVGKYRGEIKDAETNDIAGRLTAYVVDTDGAREIGFGPCDALDAVAHETAAFCSLFLDADAGNFSPAVLKVLKEDFVFTDRILIVDRLELLPVFRGRGAGLLCLRSLIQQLGSGCRLVAIKPYPLQFEFQSEAPEKHTWRFKMTLGQLPGAQREATRKLKKYYGRLGFKAVRGTDLMILDLENRLPSVESLVPSWR